MAEKKIHLKKARALLRQPDNADHKRELFDGNEMNDKTQKAQEVYHNGMMNVTYMEVTEVEFDENVIGCRLDLKVSTSAWSEQHQPNLRELQGG
jgi:hypothetical protein